MSDNPLSGSIDDSQSQESLALIYALQGMSNIMGGLFSQSSFDDTEPQHPLRSLILEKARLKRIAGDASLAAALDIIVDQYDLGLIDLTWDAWKGTVIVVSKDKN